MADDVVNGCEPSFICCPHCGEQHGESWDLAETVLESQRRSCRWCGASFWLEVRDEFQFFEHSSGRRVVRRIFSASKIKPLDGDDLEVEDLEIAAKDLLSRIKKIKERLDRGECLLRFGHGEIGMSPLVTKDRKAAAIILVKGDRSELGSKRVVSGIEAEENLLGIWRFDNVESVDVVISNLEKVKELLQGLQNKDGNAAS